MALNLATFDQCITNWNITNAHVLLVILPTKYISIGKYDQKNCLYSLLTYYQWITNQTFTNDKIVLLNLPTKYKCVGKLVTKCNLLVTFPNNIQLVENLLRNKDFS